MTQLNTLPIVRNSLSNGVDSSMASLQSVARDNLANLSIPTRRSEAWKYSAKYLGDLNTLSLSEHAQPTDSAAVLDGAVQINIVNGRLESDEIDRAKLEGASFTLFKDLDESQIAVIQEAALAHEHGEIEQLNSALFEEGLFLEIDKQTQLAQPIVLNYIHASAGMSTPRVFVLLGQSATATIVESHQVVDDASSFVANQMTSVVSANAKLCYLRMNPLGQSYKLATTTRTVLKRDAQFESHSLCMGAGMGRHDLHVLMTEPGAHCDLNGVVVTKEKQHFDNHTNIEHIAAHCTSEENYRCIADDQSHIVFNGRIHIHKDAQKTLGEMNNRNLLLSSGAEIDTKPELEIYADDVKCAHGATIGQLDEKEVYYLKTRGLSDEQARQMLTLGFVLELVRSAPIETLAARWEDSLSKLLSFVDTP